MKYILSLVLLSAFALCDTRAQNTEKGFTMKGVFDSSVESDSVYLYSKDKQLAAAPVVDGKFELKGWVDEPCSATVAVKVEGELDNIGKLILENDDYTYSREEWKVKIKGGKLHDMVLGFESSDAFLEANANYNEFLSYLFETTDDTVDSFSQEDKEKLNEMGKIISSIEENALIPLIEDPNAPLLAKFYAIERLQNGEKYDLKKRLDLLYTYREQLGKTTRDLDELIFYYQEELEIEKVRTTVASGKMFKEVEAKDVNGNIVKLSDVIAKNKYTILEFWASWCGPCRGEIPNLKKAYEKYKSKGLEIYAVSLDDNREKWLKALREENVSWISVVEQAAFKSEAVKGYAVAGIPASFLIDQDGVIIVSDQGLRGAELEKTLNELMP